jgi:hypothetical protein
MKALSEAAKSDWMACKPVDGELGDSNSFINKIEDKSRSLGICQPFQPPAWSNSRKTG